MPRACHYDGYYDCGHYQSARLQSPNQFRFLPPLMAALMAAELAAFPGKSGWFYQYSREIQVS